MLWIDTVVQPANGSVADHLSSSLQDSRFDSSRAAVAYITVSGVRTLQDALAGSSQCRRWLAGIDWCRSDPPALEALDTGPQSDVHIYDGANLVGRRGCSPRK